MGKSYLYDNKDGKLVYAGFLIKFNISKANPKFVFYNTCKSKYDNWVRIMSMRSGQPGINLNEYKKYEFKIPSDKEQEKIANFLSAIDKKIELMERKVTLYNNIKKDFFNKLFSEGNNYNIEYDNVKFKNLIKKSKAGGTPKSTIKEYYEGTIPFLSINDMTSQGKYIKSTEKHISEIGLSNSSAWLVPKNSLLYSMYASVGFVSINSIELTTSQAIYSIILKDNISLDYIYYYLSYYKKYVNKYIETGTQGNLNANIVKNLPILIPSTSNQEKIGSFLSVIDKKINLLKQEVKNNKEFKKSLLSKMFC